VPVNSLAYPGIKAFKVAHVCEELAGLFSCTLGRSLATQV